jgi:hypothetical protein
MESHHPPRLQTIELPNHRSPFMLAKIEPEGDQVEYQSDDSHGASGSTFRRSHTAHRAAAFREKVV